MKISKETHASFLAAEKKNSSARRVLQVWQLSRVLISNFISGLIWQNRVSFTFFFVSEPDFDHCKD
ncbi:unnamed protein product, partial [Vitis vinifera]